MEMNNSIQRYLKSCGYGG